MSRLFRTLFDTWGFVFSIFTALTWTKSPSVYLPIFLTNHHPVILHFYRFSEKVGGVTLLLFYSLCPTSTSWMNVSIRGLDFQHVYSKTFFLFLSFGFIFFFLFSAHSVYIGDGAKALWFVKKREEHARPEADCEGSEKNDVARQGLSFPHWSTLALEPKRIRPIVLIGDFSRLCVCCNVCFLFLFCVSRVLDIACVSRCCSFFFLLFICWIILFCLLFKGFILDNDGRTLLWFPLWTTPLSFSPSSSFQTRRTHRFVVVA